MIEIAAFRRRYLNDLPLENVQGVPMRAEDIEHAIKEARAEFERTYGVRLEPTIIKMGDRDLDGDPPNRDTAVGLSEDLRAALPYQEEHDATNYDPRAFEGSRHASLILPVGPVKQVYAVALDLPGLQKPFEIPLEMVQTKRYRKRLYIYPKHLNGVYWPLMRAPSAAFLALSQNRSIPNAWQITYLAGYTERDLERRDLDIWPAIHKAAAIKALVMGSADRNFSLGVGGVSVSVDGLSQNTQLIANAQNLKYGPLIKQYQDDFKAWEAGFAFRKSGVSLVWL